MEKIGSEADNSSVLLSGVEGSLYTFFSFGERYFMIRVAASEFLSSFGETQDDMEKIGSEADNSSVLLMDIAEMRLGNCVFRKTGKLHSWPQLNR